MQGPESGVLDVFVAVYVNGTEDERAAEIVPCMTYEGAGKQASRYVGPNSIGVIKLPFLLANQAIVEEWDYFDE